MDQTIDEQKQLDDARTRVADIVRNADKTSTNKIYNQWAKTYEADMSKVLYTGPSQLMEHFDKLGVPKDAKILDVCAGTGAIGRELAKRGYFDLHAFDGSEGMLANARLEGHYKSYSVELFEVDSKLPYEDKTFDCVLMSGVFAPGHLPIVVLREICRVTKVKGIVAFVQCDPNYYAKTDPQYANQAFKTLVDQMVSEGIWKCRDGFPVEVHPFIEYSDGLVQVFDILS